MQAAAATRPSGSHASAAAASAGRSPPTTRISSWSKVTSGGPQNQPSGTWAVNQFCTMSP